MLIWVRLGVKSLVELEFIGGIATSGSIEHTRSKLLVRDLLMILDVSRVSSCFLVLPTQRSVILYPKLPTVPVVSKALPTAEEHPLGQTGASRSQ